MNTHIIPLTNAWKKEGRKKGSFKARRYVSLYAFLQRPLLLLLLLLLLFLPWRLPPVLESPSLDEYLDSSTSSAAASCCTEPGGRRREEGRKEGGVPYEVGFEKKVREGCCLIFCCGLLWWRQSLGFGVKKEFLGSLASRESLD